VLGDGVETFLVVRAELGDGLGQLVGVARRSGLLALLGVLAGCIGASGGLILIAHAAHCTLPSDAGTTLPPMSRIETGIVSYTLSGDYYATVGADFDTEAVDDAILAELNRMLPVGIVVERSGKVFADEDKADEARRIDWNGLLKRIDVDQILAEHGR